MSYISICIKNMLRSHFWLNSFWLNFGSSLITGIMDSDDGIMCADLASQEEVDSDDRIMGVSSDEASSGDVEPARKRRCRDLPREGVFHSWLVVDRSLQEPACAADSGFVPGSAAPRCIVGLARCSWRLVAAQDVDIDGHSAVVPKPVPCRRLRAQAPWGYVQYRILERWRLDEPKDLLEGIGVDDPLASAAFFDLCKHTRTTPGNVTVETRFQEDTKRHSRACFGLAIVLGFS